MVPFKEVQGVKSLLQGVKSLLSTTYSPCGASAFQACCLFPFHPADVLLAHLLFEFA
jgi:hypothetical protein